jgi:hypothetical protein
MKEAEGGKAPISKHQSPNNNQISITQIPNVTWMICISSMDIDHWFIGDYLDIGVWLLGFYFSRSEV